jgi:hypothetical protein
MFLVLNGVPLLTRDGWIACGETLAEQKCAVAYFAGLSFRRVGKLPTTGLDRLKSCELISPP